MHFLDWIVVAAYLSWVIWQGVRLSRQSKTAESFFLAGRSLPWWAVGLSVMATQMSAITLVGTTGQAYTDGMRFIQFYLGLPLAMVILCVTAVPFFYRARVYTAYEYLERRFDARTRTLTSFFFLLSRGLGVGVIIAAPSVILSIVLGWNEVATIFAIGLSTTLYTMFGGVRAVTWTDVKQMVVIFVGLAICIFVILGGFPEGVSLGDGLKLAGATGMLQTIDFRFDLSERYTIWSGLFAAMFLFLAYFGCDQSQVQRYLTARSVDEGRTSLMMSAFLKIPVQFLILLIGVLVFVFYQFRPPPLVFNENGASQAVAAQPARFLELERQYGELLSVREATANRFLVTDSREDREAYAAANRAVLDKSRETRDFIREAGGNETFNDVNYVFPVFVIQNMPIGVVGLIIAAIMAAAMSSVAAELNSLATASTMDFYKRHISPDSDDRQVVIFGRWATLLWGVFACIVAMFATNLGSLIEVVNTFGSFFYGSLLGVFVLAFALPGARAVGAFWGLIVGIVAVWLASSFTDVAFLWFNVVGAVFTITAGLLISRFSVEAR